MVERLFRRGWRAGGKQTFVGSERSKAKAMRLTYRKMANRESKLSLGKMT